MESTYKSAPACVAALAALLSAGCFAPVNTSFETASTVPAGQFEAGGGISGYRFHINDDGDREAEPTNTNLGAWLGIGITPYADARFRYEAMLAPSKHWDELKEEDAPITAHYLSASVKVADGKNQNVSVRLPISVYLYDGDESWTFSPQLFVTPVRRQMFDLTASAKMDFYLDEEAKLSDSTVGLTLGTGFGPDRTKWAFRPELGLLFNPGEDGVILNFGAAFVKRFGGEGTKR